MVNLITTPAHFAAKYWKESEAQNYLDAYYAQLFWARLLDLDVERDLALHVLAKPMPGATN